VTLRDCWSTSLISPPVHDLIIKTWHFVTVDQQFVSPLQFVTLLPNRDTYWLCMNIPSFPSSPWYCYKTVTLRDCWSTTLLSRLVCDLIINLWHFVTVDQYPFLPLQSMTLLSKRDTSWLLINIPSFPSSPWPYYQTVKLRDCWSTIRLPSPVRDIVTNPWHLLTMYEHPDFPVQSVTLLSNRDTSWLLIKSVISPPVHDLIIKPWYFVTVDQHPFFPVQSVTLLSNRDTSWLLINIPSFPSSLW